MITKKLDEDLNYTQDSNSSKKKYLVGEIGFDVNDLMIYEVEKDEDNNSVLFVTFRNGIEKQLTVTATEFELIKERFRRDIRKR